MSAFLCSDFHISILAEYGASPMRGNYGAICTDDRRWTDPAEIFEILRAENVRSLRSRYPNEASDNGLGRFDPRSRHFAPKCALSVAIISLCHCLEYQSCESEDYRETLAYRLLCRIKNRAEHNLPGYEDAPWEANYQAEGKQSDVATKVWRVPGSGFYGKDSMSTKRASPSRVDIASDFDLWGQYMDPQGLDSREDFERLTLAEKLESMTRCYGGEL